MDLEEKTSKYGQISQSIERVDNQRGTNMAPHLRCKMCGKKTCLMEFKCKCDESVVFCIKHRYPEDHNCSFDYKTFAQKQIELRNPIIAHKKLETI